MRKAQSAALLPRSQTLLHEATPQARQVLAAAGRSGPNLGLLEWCLEQRGWSDKDLIFHLQQGFPLIGDLPVDSEAPRADVRQASLTRSQLESHGVAAWPRQLRRHSRAGALDAEIWSQTLEEAALGRMTSPQPAFDSSPKVVTRRFGVRQINSKGADKVRCIDDFKESGVNDAASVSRRIRMGRLTDLEAVTRTLADTKEPLALLKSDFKAAYRSLPLAGSDLGLASVLLRNPGGQLFSATQLAMPFGAVASVYAWDRLGAALAAILQEFLLIPCVRYVDDLFWVDFVAASAECRLAALECIDLLGFTLEESKTPAPSSCQTVLGIKVALVDNGVSLQYSPEPMKAALWVEEVSRTLNEGDVDLVGLRKLTGRLSFAAWAMWGPAARCHLRGLHQQVRLWKAPLLPQAISDLEWWARELQCLSGVTRPLRFPQQEPVLIYTDASGSGGLGAWAQQSGGFLERSLLSCAST